MDSMTIAREYTDEQGRRLIEHESGAVQDKATGKLVRGVPPLSTRLTPENASDRAWQRWHGTRQDAAVAAVRKMARGETIDTVERADAYMLDAMVTEIVLNSDVRADHRTKTWQAVLEQAGMDGRAPKRTDESEQNGLKMTLQADADTIERLVMALASAKNGIG